MTTARDRFIAHLVDQLEKPALWGAKGPDAFDCSGLVSAGYLAAGGRDVRHTHTAQAWHDETRLLGAAELPVPGDLVFYGHGPTKVEHVAAALAGGHAIDAAGATSHITTLDGARAAGARVRLHQRLDFRGDLPWRAVHRNTLVDELDRVTR